jgi:hypothetical protein
MKPHCKLRAEQLPGIFAPWAKIVIFCSSWNWMSKEKRLSGPIPSSLRRWLRDRNIQELTINIYMR